MKIAYFTQNPITVSETFFAFLATGLEKKIGSDCFWHVVGTSRGDQLIKNTLFTNFIINFRALRLLYEFEERSGVGTRIALNFMQSIAGRRLKKLLKFGLPDVAHIEYGNTAIRIYKFLKSHNIPFIVHYHGKDASADFISSTYAKESQAVFKEATYVVTASHHIRRLLVLRGCCPTKIKMVRYGIEVEKLKPLEWSERLKNGPSLVFLGRLTEKKHPIALIHAFELVRKVIPEAKLTIIGDGKLRAEIASRIRQLGLERSVDMLGALKQDAALDIINKHWIFAQHNVTAVDGDQEGYALAPAEAAALELAVVTTLHNGIPEHVIDGKTGFLVREFDYEAMADRIITLLQDTEKVISFGKAGRQNIKQINQPDERLNRIFELLKQASGTKS